MKKYTVLLVFVLLAMTQSGLTPVSNFQVDKVLNVNLNAVAYNNVNDSWARDCLGMHFQYVGNNHNQIFMNTTLWANPKPENFTLTITDNPAVWDLNGLKVVWVYADYKNHVYGFADELGMTGYVLSPTWKVAQTQVAIAVASMIVAGVPVNVRDMQIAPSTCSKYP